ncbi:hypothetical protein [Azospirillum sp. sgz302134]
MPDTSPDTHEDPDAVWRGDIDALVFTPQGHRGLCAVHRLAFRTLLGRLPEPADCLAHFAAHREAFHRAAAQKIAGRGLPPEASLHLTSRAIQRAADIV